MNFDLSFIWLITGIVLILSEFIIPGFVICFFGVSAIITAFVHWICPAVTFPWQILIFAILGVILLIACRRYMPGVFKGKENSAADDIDSDSIAGVSCICTSDISPDAPGKVEFRGSSWNAVSSDSIPAGSRCIVKARKNLTLEVVKA